MYNLHHLSHVVQLFGDICIYVSRFLTNMVQRFSDFYTTHRNITLTFIILWVIFASKIIHIYINASCSYPCGTVFRCFLL